MDTVLAALIGGCMVWAAGGLAAYVLIRERLTRLETLMTAICDRLAIKSELRQ